MTSGVEVPRTRHKKILLVPDRSRHSAIGILLLIPITLVLYSNRSILKNWIYLSRTQLQQAVCPYMYAGVCRRQSGKLFHLLALLIEPLGANNSRPPLLAATLLALRGATITPITPTLPRTSYQLFRITKASRYQSAEQLDLLLIQQALGLTI